MLGADDVRRALTRIAHEIIERNQGLEGVVLVGLQRGGVWMAEALADEIERIERPSRSGRSTPRSIATTSACGRCTRAVAASCRCDVDGATVVLVDDVLYTGRTVRAALDALVRLRAAAGRAARRARRPRPP